MRGELSANRRPRRSGTPRWRSSDRVAEVTLRADSAAGGARPGGSGCVSHASMPYSAPPTPGTSASGAGADMSSHEHLDHLDQLEQQSVYIFREAFRHFERLCMLWSIGKDSTVLLWLARKAFFGHVPFPLVHIDTSFKLPEMIAYRDRLAMEYRLQMVVGENRTALDAAHAPSPTPSTCPRATPTSVSRVDCCRQLKKDALVGTLNGTLPRKRLDLATGQLRCSTPTASPTTASSWGRAPTRRAAAPRSATSRRATATASGTWATSRPSSGTSSRPTSPPAPTCASTPCSTGPSCNIWEYIKRESIPTVSLYYDQGTGKRYRSLGCGPCQLPIESTARNVDEILVELRSGKLQNIAERSGRLQDGKHGLEELRREGYM